MGKKVKVGARRGQGKPPGYFWNVLILDLAFKEAQNLLAPVQYAHIKSQVRELASQRSPTHSKTVSVRKMTPNEYYELRDTGGVLGGLNVRLFFGVDRGARAIVVLGVITKQNNGRTPQGDIIRMRRRWRKYQESDLGKRFTG